MKIRHALILAAIGYGSTLAALYAWSHGMAQERNLYRWARKHW